MGKRILIPVLLLSLFIILPSVSVIVYSLNSINNTDTQGSSARSIDYNNLGTLDHRGSDSYFVTQNIIDDNMYSVDKEDKRDYIVDTINKYEQKPIYETAYIPHSDNGVQNIVEDNNKSHTIQELKTINNSHVKFNSYTYDTGRSGKNETLFSDDFEGWLWEWFNGWTRGDDNSESGSDYWGRSDYRAYSGTYSIWCAQEGDNSIYGGSNKDLHLYDNNMGAYLAINKKFDLSGWDVVWFEFYTWYDIGPGDGIGLSVRSDGTGGSWKELWGVYAGSGYETSSGWIRVTGKIPYSYQSTNFEIGFYFYSDNSYVSEGVYIDDFKLLAGDIVIKSITIDKTEASPGEEINITYVVDNPTSRAVLIWLGASIRDPNGNLWHDEENDVEYVLTPGVHSFERKFKIPSNAPDGKYDLIVAIWAGHVGSFDKQFDMVEINDVLNIGHPNLYIVDIWTEPDPPRIDTKVDVYTRIGNNGEVTARNFFVYMYIEDVGAYGAWIDELKPGSYINLYVDDVEITSPGYYSVYVEVDYYDDVIESNEDDNWRSEVFYWGAPNLIIEDLKAESIDGKSPEIEKPAQIIFTIKNIGEASSTSTVAYVYIEDIYMGSISVPGLNPGSSIELKLENIVLDDYGFNRGDYEVKVIVDPLNTIAEENEDDNEKIEIIHWRGPELIIEDISWEDWFGNKDPTSIKAGQGLKVKVTIRNIGDAPTYKKFYVKVSIDYGTEDLIEFNGINNGQSKTEETTDYTIYTTYPFEPIACYYIKIHAVIDPSNKINEDKENNEGEETVMVDGASWTLALYYSSGGCGGPDLSSAIQGNLDMLKSVGSTQEVNVIMMIDKLGEPTKVYYVLKGKTIEIPLEEVLKEDTNEAIMDDPETLHKFGSYIFTRFRAYHYALIINDHGAGIEGVSWDDGDNNCRYNGLQINETKIAIEKILNDADIYKLDIIGFDACLMGMLEIAYQLRDLTDYIIASEKVVPGRGWIYEPVLRDLTNNPDMSPKDLGILIIDAYVDYYSNFFNWDLGKWSVTLALINTEYVDELANTVSDLAFKLAHLSYKYREQWYEEVLSRVQRFDFEKYADLYHFLILLNNTIDQRYSDIIDLINEAAYYFDKTVIYFRKHSGWNDINVDNAYGISIYLPTSLSPYSENTWEYDKDNYYQYLEFYDLYWDEFIDSLFNPRYGIFIKEILVNPYYVPLGGYINVTLKIVNNSTYTEYVWIGTSLFDSQGNEYIDPSDDLYVGVKDGVTYITRRFDIHEDMPIDYYDIMVALWWNKDPITGEISGLIHSVRKNDIIFTYYVYLLDASIADYVDRDHDGKYSSIELGIAYYLDVPSGIEGLPGYIYVNGISQNDEWITLIYRVWFEDSISINTITLQVEFSPGTWDIWVEARDLNTEMFLDAITYYDNPELAGVVFDDDDRYITVLSLEDVSVEFSDYVILSSKLVIDNGTPIEGEIVNFYIYRNGEWEFLGSITTDSSGVAELQWKVLVSPGTYQIKAVYSGSSEYKPSETYATLTVYKEVSVINAYVIGTIRYNDEAEILVELKDNDDTPIDNVYVKLYLLRGSNREYLGKALTDTDGYAIISFNAYMAPGTYTVEVVFDGNPYYTGSSKQLTITVKKEITEIHVSDIEVIYNETITLNARATDDEDHGLGGLTVKFYLYIDSQEVYVGEASTNSRGYVEIQYNQVLEPGKYRYKVVLDETTYYLGSTNEAYLTIKCKPPEILKPNDQSHVKGLINITIKSIHVFDLRVYLKNNTHSILVKTIYDSIGETTFTLNTSNYADGRYVLEVVYTYTSIDYEETGSVSITITIDHTPPSGVITYPSNNSYVAGNVTITFSYYDELSPVEAYLVINNSIVVNVTGKYSYRLDTSKFNDGELNITLYLIDIVDNIFNYTITVIIDNTLPEGRIIEPINNTVVCDQVVIKVYYYDENLDYSILYINGTAVLLGNDTYTWNTLDYIDGLYNLTLLVMDKAGNSITYTIFVEVDNTPPYVTIVYPLNGTIVGGVITIHLNYSDPHLDQALLYIDENSLNVTGQYLITFDTRVLEDGEHVFTLVVYDRLGHVSRYSIVVIIDNTPPYAEIYYPSRDQVVSGMITIKFNYSDPNLEIVKLLINSTIVNVTGLYEWVLDTTEYPDGLLVIKLVVEDKAGNIVEETVTIIVDNTAPHIEFKLPSNYVSGIVNITWRIEEPHLIETILYINDTMYNVTGLEYFTWNTEMYSDGYYNLTLKAIDEAGNTAVKTLLVIIDNTPPIVDIYEPKQYSVVSDNVTIKFNYSDLYLDGVYLYIDEQLIGEVTGKYVYTINTRLYSDGRHKIRVEALDKAGNIGFYELILEFDNTPPIIEILSPENYTYVKLGSKLEIKWNIIEPHLDKVYLSIDNGSLIDVTQLNSYTINTVELELGEHMVKLIAYDVLGHRSEARLYFNVTPVMVIHSEITGTRTTTTATTIQPIISPIRITTTPKPPIIIFENTHTQPMYKAQEYRGTAADLLVTILILIIASITYVFVKKK